MEKFSTDFLNEIKKLREHKLSDLTYSNTLNILLLGQPKIGKTHIGTTGLLPIHVDSFDPGGTKINVMQKLAKSNDAILDTQYEFNDFRRPNAFKLWEDNFHKRKAMGYFDHIGTYMLDSFTSWVDAMTLQVASNKKRDDNIPYLNDWSVIVNTVQDYVKMFATLPCDVIMPGHLTREKDDVSGEVITKIDATPKMQNRIPQIFDEIYVMLTNRENGKEVRKLLTQPSGRYTAGSRLGGDGTFDTYEEPNLKQLRKKLGWTTEDKPKII